MNNKEEDLSKQFPSLNNCRAIILWNSGDYTTERDISRPDDTAFRLSDIKTHLIDKQNFKEAISKHFARFEMGKMLEKEFYNSMDQIGLKY